MIGRDPTITLSRRIITRLRRFGGDFARARQGMSAVEFAMIAPIMLSFYMGVVELSTVLTVDRRVTAVASSLGDLVAQVTTIDDDGIADAFTAGEAIMAPYSLVPLQIVITSVVVDGSGNGTVAWSDAHNTGPRAVGSSVTLPAGIAAPNDSVILCEVRYIYDTPFGYILSGGLNLTDKFYHRPRRSVTVERI